jgi:hypothetical protein
MLSFLQFDYLGETTEGNLHLVQRLKRDGMVQVGGSSNEQQQQAAAAAGDQQQQASSRSTGLQPAGAIGKQQLVTEKS